VFRAVPAPPLHLTFAEMMADQEGVPRSVRDAVRQHPIYVHLGGIFHDLPYYIGAVRMALGYWRGNAAEICPWGVRLHMDRPGVFSAHLVETLRHAPGPLTHAERVAFVAGFFSHAALDHTLHPLVNFAAEREAARDGGEVSHHHRLVEKYQSLFIHLELFGKDVIGQPHFYTRMARITQHNPFFRRRVDAGLAEFMTGMMGSFFGEAPSVGEWSGWVRSFRHVAFLVSGSMADRNSRGKRTPEIRERYFSNEDFDFRDFFAASRRRAASMLTLANDYFDLPRADETARAAFARAAALDNLSYPDEARHPETRVVLLGGRRVAPPGERRPHDERLCVASSG
jgi:hypothetical protein